MFYNNLNIYINFFFSINNNILYTDFNFLNKLFQYYIYIFYLHEIFFKIIYNRP